MSIFTFFKERRIAKAQLAMDKIEAELGQLDDRSDKEKAIYAFNCYLSEIVKGKHEELLQSALQQLSSTGVKTTLKALIEILEERNSVLAKACVTAVLNVINREMQVKKEEPTKTVILKIKGVLIEKEDLIKKDRAYGSCRYV